MEFKIVRDRSPYPSRWIVTKNGGPIGYFRWWFSAWLFVREIKRAERRNIWHF